MRSTTLFKFKFSAELWGTEITYDPFGEEVMNPVKKKDFKCLLVNAAGVSLSLIAKERFSPGYTVANVRDVHGNVVEGAKYITKVRPELSGEGIVVGYVHTLSDSAPRDLIASIREIAGGS